MESIQLTYPSTQQGQAFMMDNRPAAVKKWLDNLTFTDTNKALEQLFQAVKTLNRSEHKLTHREDNLETLNQGYLQMSRHFREHNDQRRVIATDHQLKLISQLTSEMAYGYKRVVNELAQSKIALKKIGRMATAINYAQHYLGIHLIEHYQQYSPIPSYIWHELHKLYHFAEHEKVHKHKQKHSGECLEPLETIEDSYKRNCLMSVINPYHVEGSQHWHLFKYFSYWANKTQLSDDLTQYSDSQCFIINLIGGKRPEYAASEIEYEEHSQYRLLNTADLLSELRNQLKHFEHNRQLPKLSFYPAIEPNVGFKLLQQVYAYCDHHIKRQDARYPIINNVDAILGLNNIITVLENHSKLENDQHLQESLSQLFDDSYPHLIRWQAVNYSNGGLCIRQSQEDVSKLSVGNIILLKRHINNLPQKSWQIGITRWLNGNISTGASLGIEYFHGEKTPASYLTKNRHGETVKHKVLLITPFDNQETRLLAPKNLIGNHRAIKLEYDGEVAEHMITATQEANSLVAMFAISRSN